MYDNSLYRIEYMLKTNAKWETTEVELRTQLNNKRQVLHYHKEETGYWQKDGAPVETLNGCTDVDISLTPFTNTLAINRLKLPINEAREIRVLYFDILEQSIRPVSQKYSRLSETTYKFENVPNDFEAIITVDDEGFVVDYPELFERTYKSQSNYR